MRKANGFGMFCSYSAAVAIPELGLYSLDALNFSELNGMFTCLIVVNVGSVFVTRRWADVLCCLQCRHFACLRELPVLAGDRVDCPE